MIHSVEIAFLFMSFKRLRLEREQIRQILLDLERVHRITESTPSPSQETESVFFFLIVEKGRFSTLPFRFEKFES